MMASLPIKLGTAELKLHGINLLQNSIHDSHGFVWTDGTSVYLTDYNTSNAGNAKHICLANFKEVVSVQWLCTDKLEKEVDSSSNPLLMINHNKGVSLAQLKANGCSMSLQTFCHIDVMPIPQGVLYNEISGSLCLLEAKRFFLFHLPCYSKGAVEVVCKDNTNRIHSGCLSPSGNSLIVAVGSDLIVYNLMANAEFNEKIPLQSLGSPAFNIRCVQFISDSHLLCTTELPLHTLPTADFEDSDETRSSHLLLIDVTKSCQLDSKPISGILSPDLLTFSQSSSLVAVGSNSCSVVHLFCVEQAQNLSYCKSYNLANGQKVKGLGFVNDSSSHQSLAVVSGESSGTQILSLPVASAVGKFSLCLSFYQTTLECSQQSDDKQIEKSSVITDTPLESSLKPQDVSVKSSQLITELSECQNTTSDLQNIEVEHVSFSEVEANFKNNLENLINEARHTMSYTTNSSNTKKNVNLSNAIKITYPCNESLNADNSQTTNLNATEKASVKYDDYCDKNDENLLTKITSHAGSGSEKDGQDSQSNLVASIQDKAKSDCHCHKLSESLSQLSEVFQQLCLSVNLQNKTLELLNTTVYQQSEKLQQLQESVCQQGSSLQQLKESETQQTERFQLLETSVAQQSETLHQSVLQLSEKSDQLQNSVSESSKVSEQIQASVSQHTQTLQQLHSSLSQQSSSLQQLQSSIQQQSYSIQQLLTSMSQQSRTLEQLQTSLYQQNSSLQQLQKTGTQQNGSLQQLQTSMGQQTDDLKKVQTSLFKQDEALQKLQTSVHQQAENLQQLQSVVSQQNKSLPMLTTSPALESVTIRTMELLMKELTYRIEKLEAAELTTSNATTPMKDQHYAPTVNDLPMVHFDGYYNNGQFISFMSFVLNNDGRIKLELIQKAFKLNDVSISINNKKCYVEADDDGYLPMTFESNSSYRIFGTKSN